MTNEKFTPGEWTAHLGIMEPTFVFIGKEDEYVDGETSVICELHHGIKKEHPGNGIMDFDQTEMRANARLIVAAPKMYERLKGVRCFLWTCLQYMQYTDSLYKQIEHQVKMMDEVLKEARGEE